MFKSKDRLPHLLMSSVVYQYIHADSVHLAMFVKQLKQFKVRISENKGLS